MADAPAPCGDRACLTCPSGDKWWSALDDDEMLAIWRKGRGLLARSYTWLSPLLVVKWRKEGRHAR